MSTNTGKPGKSSSSHRRKEIRRRLPRSGAELWTTLRRPEVVYGSIFCFMFMNSYGSLFYIAFFKAYLEGEEYCDGDSCLYELYVTLAFIFLGQIVTGNISEVGIPWVRRTVKWKTNTGEPTAKFRRSITRYRYSIQK